MLIIQGKRKNRLGAECYTYHAGKLVEKNHKKKLKSTFSKAPCQYIEQLELCYLVSGVQNSNTILKKNLAFTYKVKYIFALLPNRFNFFGKKVYCPHTGL
jgi:hypothetical protein